MPAQSKLRLLLLAPFGNDRRADYFVPRFLKAARQTAEGAERIVEGLWYTIGALLPVSGSAMWKNWR